MPHDGATEGDVRNPAPLSLPPLPPLVNGRIGAESGWDSLVDFVISCFRRRVRPPFATPTGGTRCADARAQMGGGRTSNFAILVCRMAPGTAPMTPKRRRSCASESKRNRAVRSRPPAPAPDAGESLPMVTCQCSQSISCIVILRSTNVQKGSPHRLWSPFQLQLSSGEI